MSAFNELVVTEGPRELRIQFKYGVRFQYVYHLGDQVEFEGAPPNGEHEVRGIAHDPDDGGLRYFALRFVADLLVSYRETSEEEEDTKFRSGTNLK